AIVGFFRNYLTFAHTMLFPLAWATALAIGGAVAALGAAALLVLAIAFSTARGVWLATVAVVAVLALIARGRPAAFAVAGLAAAALLGFAVSRDLRHEAAQMFGLGGPNVGRVAIYQANLDIIHAHPVLGLGFGRYQAAALPYYTTHPLADRRSHAHSDYLQIAAEAGLTGLAAFALLFGVALRRGWTAIAVANHVDIGAALRLRRALGDAEVVHFHTARAHALAPLCRRAGVRLVVTRRMDYVPAGGPYVRFLYNRAVDAVVAISEGVREALVRVGVRRDRIRVVPSG